MGDRQDTDKQAFCTRAGRFAELEALAALPAKTMATRPERSEARALAQQPAAESDKGVRRYFRWASRST
jgi:hypothetical protein